MTSSFCAFASVGCLFLPVLNEEISPWVGGGLFIVFFCLGLWMTKVEKRRKEREREEFDNRVFELIEKHLDEGSSEVVNKLGSMLADEKTKKKRG